MATEFEGYLHTVMESLTNQLGKDLSETEKKIEVLKSKFFLTDVCFEKAVDVLGGILSSELQKYSLVQLMTNLRNMICTSYVTMSQIQGELVVDVNQAKASLNNTLKEKDNELQATLKKTKEL